MRKVSFTSFAHFTASMDGHSATLNARPRTNWSGFMQHAFSSCQGSTTKSEVHASLTKLDQTFKDKLTLTPVMRDMPAALHLHISG